MTKKIDGEKIMKDWDKLATKYRVFGAADTEPDWHFQKAIIDALAGKSTIPASYGEWELYASKPGVDVAGKALTSFTEKVVYKILHAPIYSRAALGEAFKQHLWRVL